MCISNIESWCLAKSVIPPTTGYISPSILPDCFEDMIALVALFRPGPLQSGMVDNFIDRKHGREEISYPDVQWQHESLKPVLEPT
ncbi:hypothetical protein JTL96_37400, partial [Pseudomonas aeruginosa]|nr:hypothetical protein [Pseudomonas aeruginosa]